MSIATLLRYPETPPTTFAGRFAMIVSLLVQTIAMRYHRTQRAPIAVARHQNSEISPTDFGTLVAFGTGA